MRYTAAVIAAYACLAVAWVYGVVNTGRLDEGFWNSAAAIVIAAGILVATGFLAGRWWSPALALLPAVVAVPAGYEPGGPEVPIWLYLGLWGIFLGLPLMAAGVALRWIFALVRRGKPGFPRTPETGPRAASRR